MTLEEISALAEEANRARIVKQPYYEVMINDLAGRFRSGEIGILIEVFPKGSKYSVSLNLGTFFQKSLFGENRHIVKCERVFLFRKKEVRLMKANP